MSSYIRNCLSQEGPLKRSNTESKFKPFSRERNALGRIIRKNCLKKVISSEEILQTLKISTDQYFLLKQIEECEQRYKNWKREMSKPEIDQWKNDYYLRQIQRIAGVLNFKQQKFDDSYHDKIKQTTYKVQQFRNSIQKNRNRIKNKVINNFVVERNKNKENENFRLSLRHRHNNTDSSFSQSFLKRPKTRISLYPLSKNKTYQTQQYPIYRGHTLKHKKLQRSVYGKIYNC